MDLIIKFTVSNVENFAEKPVLLFGTKGVIGVLTMENNASFIHLNE